LVANDILIYGPVDLAGIEALWRHVEKIDGKQEPRDQKTRAHSGKGDLAPFPKIGIG